MILPSHLFSDFGEAHGKNLLFFPSTYSVSLELKIRKEHGGLTEPSQGNTFLYQIMKKQWKHTHTKQKPTFTRFFFYSICLAVIYRRPLKWDCLRKKAKGTFQYTSKESVIKKKQKKQTQTQPRASPVTLCSLLQLYSSFKNRLFPVNISPHSGGISQSERWVVTSRQSIRDAPFHIISNSTGVNFYAMWKCHTVASLL